MNRLAASLAWSGIFVLSAPPCAAQGRTETLLRDGDATPEGIGVIESFDVFTGAFFSPDGSLYAEAQLTESLASTAEASGLFRFVGGQLETVVRTGQTAPGGGAIVNRIRNPSSFRSNSTGQLGMRLNLVSTVDPAFQPLSVVRFDPSSGALIEIARDGGLLHDSTYAGIDDAGVLAVRTRFGGDLGPQAVVLGDGGDLVFGAIEGFRTPANDGEVDSGLSSLFTGIPSRLFANGDLLYVAPVRFDDEPNQPVDVLYLDQNGTATEIARVNRDIDEFGSKLQIRSFDNTSGDVLFGTFDLSAGNTLTSNSLYAATSGGVQPVITPGQVLPGGAIVDRVTVFSDDAARDGRFATSITTTQTEPLPYIPSTLVIVDASGAIEEVAVNGEDYQGLTRLSIDDVDLSDGGLIAFDGRYRPDVGDDEEIILLTDGVDLVEVARSTDRLMLSDSAIHDPTGEVVYTTRNIETGAADLRRFTPSLRWRGGASGAASDASAWTLGILPSAVHEVTISRISGVDVALGADEFAARSLLIGQSGVFGAGQLTVAGGSVTVEESIRLTVAGEITGFGSITGDLMVDSTSAAVRGAFQIDGDVDNNGTVAVESSLQGSLMTINGNLSNLGQVDIAPAATLHVRGSYIVESAAVVGDVVGGGLLRVSGDIGPPDSAARARMIDGSLELTSSATSLFEIGGTSISDYDRLVVTGDATLGGTLLIDFINGFEVGAGQSFTLFDNGGLLSGQFAGLSDGDRLGTFNDNDLFITYAGGDGNDVVLFSEPPAAGPIWVGGAGVWHDGANWSTGVVPGAEQVAVIDFGNGEQTSVVSVDRNPVGNPFVTQINRLRIDAGETIKITPEVRFEILSGLVENDGLIVLETSAPGGGNTALRTETDGTAPVLVIEGAGEVRLEGGQISGLGITIGASRAKT